MALRVTSIFAHQGNGGDLGDFASGNEAAAEIAERRLAAGGGTDGHVKSSPYWCASAGDGSCPLQFAGVVIEGARPTRAAKARRALRRSRANRLALEWLFEGPAAVTSSDRPRSALALWGRGLDTPQNGSDGRGRNHRPFSRGADVLFCTTICHSKARFPLRLT